VRARKRWGIPKDGEEWLDGDGIVTSAQCRVFFLKFLMLSEMYFAE